MSNITLSNIDTQKVVNVIKTKFPYPLVDDAEIEVANNADNDFYNINEHTEMDGSIKVVGNGQGGLSVSFSTTKYLFNFTTKRTKVHIAGIELDKTALGTIIKQLGPKSCKDLMMRWAQHEMIVDAKAMVAAGTLRTANYTTSSWLDMTDSELINDLAAKLGVIETAEYPVPDRLAIAPGAGLNRLRQMKIGSMTIGSGGSITFASESKWHAVSKILEPANIRVVNDQIYSAYGENSTASNYLGVDVILYSSKTADNPTFRMKILSEKIGTVGAGAGLDDLYIHEQKSSAFVVRPHSAFYLQNAMKVIT